MTVSLDCWNCIFSLLDPGERLGCSVVCNSWFERLKGEYKLVVAWRLIFVENACNLVVKFDPFQGGYYKATVRLCNCPGHADEILRYFRVVCQAAAPYAKYLTVEDDFVNSVSSIDGRLIQLLLKSFVRMVKLELYNLKITGLEDGQFEVVKFMKDLNTFFVEECYPNFLVNDRLLCNVASVERITEIFVRRCETITDASLKCIGQKCPYLNNVDISGCKGITSKGIADLVVSLDNKVYDMLHIKVSESSVDGQQLKRLSEQCFDDWMFVCLKSALGLPACCIYRRTSPHKSVLIYA